MRRISRSPAVTMTLPPSASETNDDSPPPSGTYCTLVADTTSPEVTRFILVATKPSMTTKLGREEYGRRTSNGGGSRSDIGQYWDCWVLALALALAWAWAWMDWQATRQSRHRLPSLSSRLVIRPQWDIAPSACACPIGWLSQLDRCAGGDAGKPYYVRRED